jgi:flagellar M-ring protein FliF
MADAVVNQNNEMVSNDSGVFQQAGSIVSQVSRIYNQPAFQRSLPTFIALAVAVIGLGAYLWMQQPTRTTLYAGLPEAEKSRVLDALRNSGVNVTLDPVTGDVLVPTENYHSSRMTLAAQGLPASAATGYEQLDSIQMGSSRSVEAARLKQSQEMELARSISEIDLVISARVHLALPDKEVFVRQQAEPTASVFLQLARGRSLGRSQVEAILHLVSASVPSLTKENVSVVDQNGNLLSRSNGSAEGRLSNDQLEHRIRLEDIYRARITSLLSPIVGAGNINAQINLDIDFTRSEVTEEIVDPNGNALRSEQNTSDKTMAAQAKGIPGALANQPPAAANLETQSTANGGNEEMRSQSSSEVKNYEVSRTVSSTMKPTNVIRKINAAVLVRERTIMDPETGLPTTQKMSEGELLQIEKARKLDITEEIYFDVIRQKTASLISTCCEAGAISAERQDSAETMRKFGEYIGISFQLKDDIFDYGEPGEIGKPTGLDIRERKMTLPLIFVLNNSTPEIRKELINIVKNHNENPKKVRRAVQLVIENGGIEYAHMKMLEFKNKALELIKNIPNSDAKTSIIGLVDYTTKRKK